MLSLFGGDEELGQAVLRFLDIIDDDVSLTRRVNIRPMKRTL